MLEARRILHDCWKRNPGAFAQDYVTFRDTELIGARRDSLRRFCKSYHANVYLQCSIGCVSGETARELIDEDEGGLFLTILWPIEVELAHSLGETIEPSGFDGRVWEFVRKLHGRHT